MIAQKDQKWLASWTAAVAFDRPKDFEIITHQSGTECCSKEFADALALALSGDVDGTTLKFESSRNGGTTDTSNYRRDIPECTNVGVGYYDHHTSNEYIDYAHLRALAAKCCVIDWNALPIKRDPKAVPKYESAYHGGYGGGGYGNYGGAGSANFPKSGATASAAGAGAAKKDDKSVPKAKYSQEKTTLETLYNEAVTYESIIEWFELDPELTARGLMQALIEGRNAQIAYNMLLSKTLNLKE
jgi:hypothetical protein